MTNPIYIPQGRAREYGEYAINIYTGCNNGCYYCYAPRTLRVPSALFNMARLRVDDSGTVVEAVQRQLWQWGKKGMRGKRIALCFTCDPYPNEKFIHPTTGKIWTVDTTPTRDIIRLIKNSGNYVQILTKNPTTRDFDLLGENDWFGITLTGRDEDAAINEPRAMKTSDRIMTLYDAEIAGINSWVSFEPVLDPEFVYEMIEQLPPVKLYRIGKLNYYPSDINWGDFGRKVEALCKRLNRNYYIKEDLRREMAQ